MKQEKINYSTQDLEIKIHTKKLLIFLMLLII